MLPVIPKPPITKRQKALAMSVAGFVDLLQIGVFPYFGEGFFSPFQDALDFITAVALMAICGFKWQFIVAFLLELTPVVDLFPTWTAVVLILPTQPHRENVSPVSAPNAPPGTPLIEVNAISVPPVQTGNLGNPAKSH